MSKSISSIKSRQLWALSIHEVLFVHIFVHTTTTKHFYFTNKRWNGTRVSKMCRNSENCALNGISEVLRSDKWRRLFEHACLGCLNSRIKWILGIKMEFELSEIRDWREIVKFVYFIYFFILDRIGIYIKQSNLEYKFHINNNFYN